MYLYCCIYLYLDRVVDELNPESNFTWKDVTTLIQDDEDDGPVQELSKFASSYTDEVLKYLVSEMSPSLSKVSILSIPRFGYSLYDQEIKKAYINSIYVVMYLIVQFHILILLTKY